MRFRIVLGITGLLAAPALLAPGVAVAHEKDGRHVHGPRVLPPVEAQRPRKPPPAPPPRRSVWLAATYEHLFSDALSPAHQNGAGASVSYEFHVSPRFLVGLPLG